jgi:hypothetical protein
MTALWPRVSALLKSAGFLGEMRPTKMSVHQTYQIVYIINLLKEQALLIFGQVQVKLHVLQEAINVFLVILIQPISN